MERFGILLQAEPPPSPVFSNAATPPSPSAASPSRRRTAILHQWLKAGYLERHAFHPTIAGTPQGGPISPVLANLTLDGLERLLTERYPKRTRAGTRAKVNFVRFADDFIVTGSSKEMLET